MQMMYPGIVNSPVTELSAAITAAATSITLLNGAALPVAPNLAVIGSGELAETILYTVKSGNTISGITRGLQGTARAWPQGTGVSRNFTEYDYAALIANILELDTTKAGTAAATTSANGLMTAAMLTKLNGIDTGAQVNPGAATTNADGLMSSADKSKLNGIAAGAQVNRSISTQVQAEAGTDNTTDMTPLRVKNAIDARTNFNTTGGSATALTLSLTPTLTSYRNGTQINVKLHTNTGPNPTINVDGLGARAMYDSDGVTRFSGESGKIYSFILDGSNFILRSGGGGGKLNVYTGTTQPTKKEGIWIQTSTAVTAVQNDLNMWLANAYSNASYAPLPQNVTYPLVIAYQGNLYSLGGTTSTSGNTSALYRYNVSSNTWTALTSIPYGNLATQGSTIEEYNGRFYVFFSNLGVYEYNISTNQWQQLANTIPPYNKDMGSSARVGNRVYFFGGSGVAFYNMSFDLVSKTWSTHSMMNSSTFATLYVAAVGTKIYLSWGNNVFWVYDTATDSWASINTPAMSRSVIGLRPIAVGNLIYSFYNQYELSELADYYNTSTNTWTALPSRSGNANYGNMFIRGQAFLNGLFYFVGGRTWSPYSIFGTVGAFALTSKSFPNGTVIVYRADEAYGQWQTELLTPAKPILGVNTRLLTHFDDVFIHDGTTLRGDLPSYYGNGTSWVRYKN